MFAYPLFRRLALALACALPCAGAAAVAAAGPTDRVVPLKHFVTEVYTADSGLPSTSVMALHAARDGYLWLGTAEGIARFDGLKFTTFGRREIPGLRNQFVNAIAEDHRGLLWFGTRGGGVVRFDGTTFRIFTEDDGLAHDYVFSLLVGDDGRVWAGTRNGLSVFEGDEIQSHRSEGRAAWNAISAMGSAPDGSILLGTQGGIQRLDDYLSGTESGTITVDDGLPAPGIWSIRSTSDGRMLVGTDRGVVWVADGRVSGVDAEGSAPVSTVRGVIETAPEVFWFVSEDLWRMSGNRMESFRGDGATGPSAFFAITTDRDGNVWAGGSNGLIRLREGRARTLGTADGLPSSRISGVTASRNGGLWFSTLDRGLIHFDPQSGVFRSIDRELPHSSFFSVYEDSEGAVWLPASGRGGIVRYRNGEVRQFTTQDGLNALTTFSVLQDRDGRYWIATYGSGLAVLEDGAFTMMGGDAGLRSSNIRTLLEARDGTIWIGSYAGGLTRFRNDRTETFTVDDGLPDNTIYSLYESADGTLWIGTLGGGLARFRGGSFASFGSPNGLVSDAVNAIIEDDFGNLWLGTRRGVLRLSRTELEEYLDGNRSSVGFLMLDRRDGLSSSAVLGGSNNKVARTEDGRLWFVMDEGVSIVDPARVTLNPNPPLVRIESVEIEGISTAGLDGLRLNPGERNLEIAYTGISMVHGAGVRFQYRLDGYDADWVDAGTRRKAFYTNLPPGEYAFRVRAANADGIWSTEEAVARFVRAPHFYETAWFFLMCALLMGTSAFGAHTLHVYRLRRRARELSLHVEARTQDLQLQKETSDRLARRLQEIDEAKSRFFANVSHEFRTPLTLILGPIERALAGELGPMPDAIRSQLVTMNRNASRLLRLINQLLELTRIESGEPVIESTPVDFAALTRQAASAYGSHSESERVSLTTDAPSPVYVGGNAEQLETVIHNLVSNALKYTPVGGSVSVTVRHDSAESEGTAVLTVCDTGSGIAEADLKRVFDRFYRAAHRGDDAPSGTGIGLSLSRQIVEAHGGTIRAVQAEGGGAEFVVSIPTCDPPEGGTADSSGDGAAASAVISHLASRAPAFRPASAPPVEPGSAAPLILVVEDELDMRDYIASVLSSEYGIETASDGQAALERLESLAPDLIISDLMMPGIDGLTLHQSLPERHSEVPFILLTARTSAHMRLEGLQAGVTDYIAKPFDAPELRARVRNAINLHRQRRLLDRLNRELQLAIDSLEHANLQKSRLLGMAAHELKNPLTAISGFAELLGEEIPLNERTAEMLFHIQNSSSQAMASVTALLDSAALESGQIQLRRGPVDMCALVERIVDRYAERLRAKNQRIDIELAKGPCEVNGDSIRILEILENLVSNAAKYSRVGGAISISVERTGEELHVAVTDSGPGLTEEDLENLFKPFQRLSANPTGNESSTGLGLSLARQFAIMHGGRIEVETRPGEGSTFTAVLPLLEGATAVPHG